jgi:hypothetical protein
MRNQENRDALTPRRPTLSERKNREYSFLAEEVEEVELVDGVPTGYKWM